MLDISEKECYNIPVMKNQNNIELNEEKRLKNHPIMKRTEARMDEWRKQHPISELGEALEMWRKIYNEERLIYINESLG